MSPRRIDCFFYGLFMDVRVLREAGAEPADPRRASVDDFALRLGRRATLVPAPGFRAYGMLIALTHAELDRLYGAAGLESYRPEAVLAGPFDGEPVPALCYNLVEPPASDERNPDYATRLRSVLEELGFSDDYVKTIG